MKIKPNYYVNDIPPYRVEQPTEDFLNLASNELQRPLSDVVKRPFVKCFEHIGKYPEPTCASLRSALAERFGINESAIMCGVGSSDIILTLIRAFVGSTDQVGMLKYGYLFYRNIIRSVGATAVDLTSESSDTICAELSKYRKVKAVLIDNPNNPFGSILSKETIRDILRSIPPDILVIHDCAYDEFVTDPNYDNCLQLVHEHKNLVVVKTFSKAYGLAGCRVGWAYGSEHVIGSAARLRIPGVVSSISQQLALAALSEEERISSIRIENSRLRVDLSDFFKQHSVSSYSSQGNYILVRFQDQTSAEACNEWLIKHKILVRPMGGYGLPQSLRITIGTRPQMRRLQTCLTDFFQQET